MKKYKVIKRNGETETLDVTKIKKVIQWATLGLPVNSLELESQMDLTFRDGMTSKEIHGNLITNALKLTNVDKDENMSWRFVASRLLLMEVFKDSAIVRGYKKIGYQNFYKFVVSAVKSGLYDSKILDEYEKEDFEEMEKEINLNYDFGFDYAGMNLLSSRYLIKNNGRYFELPQHMYLVMAMLLAVPEKKEDRLRIAKEIYHVTASRQLSLATPIVLNLRKPNGSLASCFPGTQEIVTISGMKEIQNILKNDLVLTHNNRFRRVIATKNRNHVGKLLDFDVFGIGKSVISCTPDHKILSLKSEIFKCIRGNMKSNCLVKNGSLTKCKKKPRRYSENCENLNKNFNSGDWNEAKDLSVGDFVNISFENEIDPLPDLSVFDYVKSDIKNVFVNGDFIGVQRKDFELNQQVKQIKNKIRVNADFGLFVGYYLAEGYSTGDLTRFTFNSKELNYIEDVCKLSQEIFGISAQVIINKDSSTNVDIRSVLVSTFIKNLVGSGFSTKKLPRNLMTMDPLIQKHVLIGAIRGDGCSFGGEISLTMCNKELMLQMFEICLRNGFSPTFSKCTRGKLSTETPYKITLIYHKHELFVKEVGKNIEKLKDSKNINTDPVNVMWVNGKYYAKISNVNERLTNELVYDLEVEEDHSFSANHVSVHNCFIGAMDDSLNSIFYTLEQIAQISKRAGGVGMNLSRIRSEEAAIQNIKGASGGVIPWVKLINDTAVAVNQTGSRAGAVTVALDVWHRDIEHFLEMQAENGDQRNKCYDIFPQIVIPDIFMKRVTENKEWTLFDPHEVNKKYGGDVAALWGSDFETLYQKIENDKELEFNRKISAKELFKKFLKTVVETGMPYVAFKDSINRRNPNKHAGMIGNGNLCMESYSNFKPSYVQDREFDESGNYIQKSSSGYFHTCNLASINLAEIHTDEQLEKVTRTAVKVLDNALELTMLPIPEATRHNDEYKILGIGTTGLNDWIVKNGKTYLNSKEMVSELYEKIAFYSVDESANLSKERGKYSFYEGSDWSKGILFGKDKNWFTKEKTVLGKEKWFELIDKVQNQGIRHGGLLAIAPNTSTSLLMGCTSSVLPVYSKFFLDKASKGTVPIIPPYLKTSTFFSYIENKNIDQNRVVEMVSEIQKWVDQGISMELTLNINEGIKAKDIYNLYMNAWKSDLKTVYYIRSIAMATNKDDCVSCAN